MKLLIDIDEKIYRAVIEDNDMEIVGDNTIELGRAIANGIPLPYDDCVIKVNIPEDKKQEFIDEWRRRAGKGLLISDRDYFNGICPYTNKKCDTWTCNTCEVEARERKFAEGDTE